MPSNAFHRFSCALTGESGLDERLSGELEQRIKSQFPEALADLLAAFSAPSTPADPDKAVPAALGDSEDRHRVAREILRVWYTGQFETLYEGFDAPRTPEQWEQGLLWRVIKAPAPGFSKNPYGVWADKPA